MRGFVACWFFPPVTSSEGIVTYKLLKNSAHEYDVCGSTSKKWSFDAEFVNEADNINVISVETDSVEEWVEKCVHTFESENKKKHYDFIMTRSMPPEALEVGLLIKEKYPDVPWIASMGDPIANNPYEIQAYIYNSKKIPNDKKNLIREKIEKGMLNEHDDLYKKPGIERMVKGVKLENKAFEIADLLVCPCEEQKKYMMQFHPNCSNFISIPHTYDTEMYREVNNAESDRIVISFIGSSDKQRTLTPLVQAIKLLRDEERYAMFDAIKPGISITDKVLIKLAGNHPIELYDMVVDFYVDECFEFVGNISYLDSLKMMNESDWLLNVDAKIPEVFENNTIFFAGKLADYMGAGTPIISITDEGSPADLITKNSGGISLYDNSPEKIAEVLKAIVNNNVLVGEEKIEYAEYRKRFDAKQVSKGFDRIVEDLICRDVINDEKTFVRSRQRWYPARQAQEEKLITVCVPSYNVEKYLDRCLNSLISHDMAGYLDIVIVNDGSRDRTIEIAREYECRYPGIIRVIDKENGGHGSTINAALKIAKGKYFKVVDSDDWVHTPSFEKLISKIRDEYDSVDVISTEYDMVDLESADVTPWKVRGFHPEYDCIYKFDEGEIKKCYFTMHSSFFKTDVLRKHGKQLQEHTFYVDVEYILFPVPFIHTAIFSDLHIYRYCLGRDEQSVNKVNMVKRFDNHDRVIKSVIDYYLQATGTDAQLSYMKWVISETIITHYNIMMVFDDDKERGLFRAKEFDEFLKDKSTSLYRKTNKNTVIRDARKCNFVFSKIEKRARFRNSNIVKRVLKHKNKKRKKAVNNHK